jgi:hypothetical protein
MGFGNPGADGQSKARAFLGMGSRIIGAIEPVEDPRMILLRNPNTVIGHGHPCVSLLDRQRDVDDTTVASLELLRQRIGQVRPMCTSVDLSFFLFFNIDTGDKRRRPCNALKSSLSPDPRHLAFAFAGPSSTSDFSVREVLALMSPPDAEDRLLSSTFLLSLT